jgi:beta-lactamase class D
MRPLIFLSFVSLLLSAPAHAADLKSTFVLRDLDSGQTAVDNPAMAARGYLPCSTFKIPNTLIALQTGVVDGEGFALRWDGVERKYAAWNRDQTLASALRDSVVWFYQDLARRIGEQRMKDWLARLDYGNRSTCCAIDRFWLDGALRITPTQQVDFLSRLVRGETPIAPAHVALVRRLLVLDQIPGYTIMGKTGSGTLAGEDLAWLVGWVDARGHRYAYAFLAVAPPGQAPSREARVALVRARLIAHHVIADQPAD